MQPDEKYAIVQLKNGKRIAGKWSEVEIAGKLFIRIDVLNADGSNEMPANIDPILVDALFEVEREVCLMECARINAEIESRIFLDKDVENMLETILGDKRVDK